MTKDILVITAYGSSEVITVTGNTEEVNLKIDALKARYPMNAVAEVTEEMLTRCPKASDRWDVSVFSQVEV